MTTTAAGAARRTLAAGSARIRRDVFDPDGEHAVLAYEGLADITGRRVRLDRVGGGLARVYGEGALRHEAQDGTWSILDRRPGRGDPLAILDWLTRATSVPAPGDEEDVRGIRCERLDFRTDGDPLVIGRAWVGPDDRLRRLDWRVASGTRVRIELWDFGVPAALRVPDAQRLGRSRLAGALLREAGAGVRRRLRR